MNIVNVNEANSNTHQTTKAFNFTKPNLHTKMKNVCIRNLIFTLINRIYSESCSTERERESEGKKKK